MSWRWLATLPSTNALVATGIFMALTTTFRVVMFNWSPPDGWYTFIVAFSITGAAQFVGKKTDFRNGQAEPETK